MSYEPTNWKSGDKVTSAKLNKIENGIQGNDEEISNIKEDLSAMNTASATDVGKALKVKTVTDGKVTEWEFGEAGGGEDYSEDIEELRSAVFYEKSESMVNTPTTSATANIMWGFHLPNIYTKSVTVAPVWNVTSGTYVAKRWHCDDATFPNSAVLTEVETKTGNIGDAVTFEDVTPNDFITFLSDVTTDKLRFCSAASHEYDIPMGQATIRSTTVTYTDVGAYFASSQFDIVVDASNLEKKLDKNQGTENADKVLTVNADGNVSAKAIPDQLGYKQYIEYTTGLWLTDGKANTSVANRCRSTQRISLPAGKTLTVEPYTAVASVYPVVYVWNSGDISSNNVITINNGASDKSVITLQYEVDKVVGISWVSVSGVDASAFVGLTYITHRIDDILPSDVLEGKNLIRSAVTANTFYGYYSNGNLPPVYAPTNKNDWWQTGLIPVVAGHTYEGFLADLAIDWFDSSKAFLSTTASALNKGSVTAPTGASYGRFIYAMATYTTDHLYDITDCNREAENYLPTSYLSDNVKSDYIHKPINAVAFGTSLTYRATHRPGGYLNIVEMESGITFDNQGIGSSFIKTHGDSPSMMDAITEYTGYANKNLILLEGFVNDWFYGGPVGT